MRGAGMHDMRIDGDDGFPRNELAVNLATFCRHNPRKKSWGGMVQSHCFIEDSFEICKVLGGLHRDLVIACKRLSDLIHELV